MTEAYPLSWPPGRPRARIRYRSAFKQTVASALQFLRWEVERLGARNLVVSSNVPVRSDGFPYASARKPDDPGVAVYFTLKGKQTCLACDKWDKFECNLHAIAMTIEAMRGISRWGSGEMMDAAFSGFQALPAPGQFAKRSWRQVLGLESSSSVTADGLTQAYRLAAKRAHPDLGGSQEHMAEVNQAYEEAKRELGI